MNSTTADVFINAVILLAGSGINDDEHTIPPIISSLIETYTKELSINPALDTALTKKFLLLLTALQKLNGAGTAIEKSLLITEFLGSSVVCGDDEIELLSLLRSMYEESRQGVPDNVVRQIKKKITNNISWLRLSRAVRKMYGKLNQYTTTADEDERSTALIEVIGQARTLTEICDLDVTSIIDSADESVRMTNKRSLSAAFEKVIETDDKAILRCGLQGLNKMMGPKMGFQLGDLVVIYGIRHDFKSGLLLTLFRGFALYNDASLFCPQGKTPLLLLISLENYARKNAAWLYETAYIAMYKKRPDPKMTKDEIIYFVAEAYKKCGWEFDILRFRGTDFDMDKLHNLVDGYEAMGYHIVALGIDYLEKMKKSVRFAKDQSHDSFAANVQAFFDLGKQKGFLGISPHQFGRKAAEIIESGQKLQVVKYLGTSGIGSSYAITQIADVEVAVHIEKDLQKQPWLTIQWMKHRSEDHTKEIDKYCAYRLHEELGLIDDINTSPTFVRDIYTLNDTDKQTKLDELF